MTNRSQAFIDRLAIWLWPVLRFLFRIDVMGAEHLPKGPALIVANHNSGALIESHSLVFLLNEQRIRAFGLNHQALFKIPFVGSYFRKIGAISATREAAVEALQAGAPVLIFPGGNREAFRSLKEDSCCYGWGQGWSDIAVEQSVPVVVVKFSGTHGINPIYLSSEFLSRALLLPWLLKVRYFPLSLAQMLCATVGVLLSSALGLSPEIVALVGYLGFVMTPLVPVLPRSVKIKIYPPLSPGQDFSHSAELREEVLGRMALRDIPSGPRVPYRLNGIEKFVLYNESAAVSYNSQFVFEFTGRLDREHIYAITRRWVTEIPYLRTAHTRGWWAPKRFSYRDAWFEPSDIVHFEVGLDQKKMDEFCGRRLNLAFEPGVRFLVQSDGERHRLIFSCHHSLFDGAAQAYVFEAWSRLTMAGMFHQLSPF
ncbi:MAG: 1-acyl-sn-glycerol-3-phosphate acyltransferase [Bdellovibrionales bacterium]|nr:1-acyl-sn-glycerol-3-phosphate acyltransferase [Bdellovibrionales bacterium]